MPLRAAISAAKPRKTALALGLWIGALGLFRIAHRVDLDAAPDRARPTAPGGH